MKVEYNARDEQNFILYQEVEFLPQTISVDIEI